MQNSALQQLSFPKAASQKSIPPWTLGHSSGAGPSFSDNLSALARLSPAFWECPRPGAGLMILADLFQLRIFWAAFSPLVSVPYSSQGECSLSGIQAVQVPSPASSSGCFCPEGVRERMGSLSYHWFILLSSWCLEWESLSCSKQMDRCLQASAEVPAGRKGLNSFLFIVCFWNKTSWPGFFSPFLFFFFFSSDYTLPHYKGANAFVSQDRTLPDTDMFNISCGLPNTSGMWTSLCFLIMPNNEMWK